VLVRLLLVRLLFVRELLARELLEQALERQQPGWIQHIKTGTTKSAEASGLVAPEVRFQ
jgi:hypothetical protein